jgi:DNA-binding LytR/AlgR family response regulator
MLKAVIIEDENPAVSELRDALAEVAPQVEVVAVCRSIADAVVTLPNLRYDLVFMDIRLGDGMSFDIFKRVNIHAPVIFTTAYDEYALQAFANKGIDYLLKPFGRDDLRRALNKLNLLEGRSAPRDGVGRTYRQRFLVHTGDKMHSIPVESVAYFMADGKYLHLITGEGRDFIVEETLAEVTESMDPERFFRINRKFLVSFPAIVGMVRYSGNRVKLTLTPAPVGDGSTIVSSDRVQSFRTWLNR